MQQGACMGGTGVLQQGKVNTDSPGIAMGWVSMQPNTSGLRSAGQREQLPCISKGCNKRENFVYTLVIRGMGITRVSE